jgi:MoaA/NifB/PqqE/SkfB family radical SAM enzyme
MYFAPDGQVRACCVNTEYSLGRIGDQTIREIWEGAQIRSLRTALDRHDFSLGCRDCEHRIAAGDRAWSTAEQYDPYLADEPGSFPRRMDFILSIACNLQCAMCNGDLSSSIRMHREQRPPLESPYGDAFFDELAEFLPHLERSVFLGGEPFVGREPQRVFDLMIAQGHTGEVQVVTNGTQWNRRIERYLRELPMSVTVSIDGYTAETLEPLRVGVDRDKLFANVDRYQEAVEHNGGTVSFHFCLMRQNWHEFGAFLLEADRRDVSTIVMTVTGPAGFSLWDLPERELRQVLESLEREDREIAGQLGRNRGVWDAELDRVRRHLEAIEGGQIVDWVLASWSSPSEVPVALGEPDPGDVGAQSLELDLGSWAGRKPVVLHVAGGVIQSVDAEPWADPLDPHGWIGLAVAELPAHLAAWLGSPSTPEVEQHGLLSTSTTRFGGDEHPVEFRAVVGPGIVDHDLRVVVATDADLSSNGRGAP